MEKKIPQLAQNPIFRITAFIIILIGLNFVAQKAFFRIDLTSEKRYSLSVETKTILRQLDEPVTVNVYLAGELNIGLKRFQRQIDEILGEFKAYAGRNLSYHFVDPFADANIDEQEKILQDMAKRGLSPINIHQRDNNGSVTEKIVVPGAMIGFKQSEIPLNLLKNDPGKSSDENLLNSVIALEYEFISNIRNITQKNTRKIVMIEGHGELPDAEVGDFMREMGRTFQVDRGIINGRVGILDGYEAVIIAQPFGHFDEADKFVLDQYIMQGGKVVWLLDAVQVNFDSLVNGQTLAYPQGLNLDDMLFRYGVRIDPSLIEDMQCNFIPVNVALAGNPANFQPAPWLFYPIIAPGDQNIITHNLNMIWLRDVSPIDTFQRENVTYAPLLITSENTQIRKTPTVIDLAEINLQPSPESLNEGEYLCGVVLEGSFESVFKNRMVEKYLQGTGKKFIEKSVANKMVVISDGDIIRNDVRYTNRGPVVAPLGMDKYTRQTFGNKELLSNIIQYLTDEVNLIQLRGKEFKIRMLDRKKLQEQRKMWQVINLVGPVAFTVLLAVIILFLRKRNFVS